MQHLGAVDAQKWDQPHCNNNTNNSSHDKVVVLDFGRPLNLRGGGAYYGYGTKLPSSGTDIGYDTAVYLTEQYAYYCLANAVGLPKPLLSTIHHGLLD